MKKRSLCFKYGNFSAVLFALALGLASCHLEKKTGTAPNSAIKTEDISWEEKSSAQGCSRLSDGQLQCRGTEHTGMDE